MRYLAQILITLVMFTLSSYSFSQCGGPVPMLCDADGDRDVDSNDISAIGGAKGTPSSGPGDLRDVDGDGMITVLDARKCVALCDHEMCVSPESSKEVTWRDGQLSPEAIDGSVILRNVWFTTSQSIAGSSFRIQDRCYDQGSCSTYPRLEELVEVIPLKSGEATAGVENELILKFTIPTNTPAGDYIGTLHVYDQESELDAPLSLNLRVGAGSAFTFPEGIPFPTEDRIRIDSATGRRFVEGEVAVVLTEGGDSNLLQSQIDVLGGVFVGSIEDLGIFQIRFKRTGQSLDSIIAQLSESPFIDAVIPISEIDSFAYPDIGNDPEIPWLQSSVPNPQIVYEYINLPQAWDVTKGSFQTNIGVIDNGFDIYHEDLQSSIGSSASVNVKSHGTGVAGVIGAIGNNAVGTTGVMWGSRLQLFGSSLINHVTTVAQIYDAAEAGSRVINISQGTTVLQADPNKVLADPFYKIAFKKYPNVLFVLAAGGTQDDVRFTTPSRLASNLGNVISVTALDATDWKIIGKDQFDIKDYTPVERILTNRGDVSLAAPGCVLTTGIGNTYKPLCGSSFSAPLVSGVAGLALSVNENLSGAELKSLIVNGSCAGKNKVNDQVAPPVYILDAYQVVKNATNPDNLKNACSGKPITDMVTVNGRKWAQPDLFTNLSWNEINFVCPAGACNGTLNGYNVTGWTWASANDVNSLFNTYIGAPLLGPGPDAYNSNECDSRWVEAFFDDGWRPTSKFERLTQGLLSEAIYGPGYVRLAYMLDVPCVGGPFNVDSTATLTSTEPDFELIGGAFFYR